MNITKISHPNKRMFQNILLSVVSLFFALFSGMFISFIEPQNAYASDSTSAFDQEYSVVEREDFASCVSPVVAQTKSGVYQIDNDSNLSWLVNSVNGTNGEAKTNFYGKSISLNYSPNLKNYYWTPIGVDNESAFCGKFDGLGNKVSNMTIKVSESIGEYYGFFGLTSNAVIKNLCFENAQVGITSSSSSVFAGVVVASCDGDIINCHAKGDIVLLGKNVNVGGIAGAVNGNIQFCSNAANILITVSNNSNVGGVVGLSTETLMFTKSYNTGDVKTAVPSDLFHYVENRFSAGLVGNANQITIEDCFNLGDVYSPSFASGIVGNAKTSAVVNRVYNSSNISAPVHMDAISADLDIVVANSYTNTDLVSNSHYSTAKTTSQLKSQANYSGFDFDNVWTFPDVQSEDYLQGYPIIKKQDVELTSSRYSMERVEASAIGADTVVDPSFSNQYALVDRKTFNQNETNAAKFVGKGTESEPYEISSVLLLQKFLYMIDAENSLNGVYFKLTTNLSSYYSETLSYFVNQSYYTFSGVLDGDGHWISGLWTDDFFIFNVAGATIKNINISLIAKNNYSKRVFNTIQNSRIENVSISNPGKVLSVGSDRSGVLASVIQNSVLRDVIITHNAYNTTLQYSSEYYGAYAGEAINTEFYDCIVLRTTTGAISAKKFGNFVGKSTNCLFQKCQVECTNYFNSEIGISVYGGFVGEDSGSRFMYCLRKANVSLTFDSSSIDNYFGGIVGLGDEQTYIFRALNRSGTITTTGSATVGGIIGANGIIDLSRSFSAISSNSNNVVVSGIAGKACAVWDCSVGADITVTGTARVAGICYEILPMTTVNYQYRLAGVRNSFISAGITALSAEEIYLVGETTDCTNCFYNSDVSYPLNAIPQETIESCVSPYTGFNEMGLDSVLWMPEYDFVDNVTNSGITNLLWTVNVSAIEKRTGETITPYAISKYNQTSSNIPIVGNSIDIKVMPNTNQVFCFWVLNGEIISYDPVITLNDETKNYGRLSAVMTTYLTLSMNSWQDVAHVAEGYEAGAGTQNNPYKIKTAAQFAKISYDSQLANNGRTRGVYYKLVSDIDLGDYCWNVDDTQTIFEGNLDGDNHIVTGLVVKNSKGGLFGKLENATIKNIKFFSIDVKYRAQTINDNLGFFSEVNDSVLKSITIEGRVEASCSATGNAFGVLAGSVDCTSNDLTPPLNEVNAGQIIDITIFCNTKVYSACQYIGGVVGQMSHCWISRCSTGTYINYSVLTNSEEAKDNELLVRNFNTHGTLKIGGVCGKGDENVVLYLCNNDVKIVSHGNAIIGGILGEYGRLDSCWLSKPIRSNDNYAMVGGIAGYAYTIIDCNVFIRNHFGEYLSDALAIEHSYARLSVMYNATIYNGSAGASFDGGVTWNEVGFDGRALNPDDGRTYTIERTSESTICSPIISGIVCGILNTDADAYFSHYGYEIKNCTLSNDITTNYKTIINQQNGHRYSISPVNSLNDENLTFEGNNIDAFLDFESYLDHRGISGDPIIGTISATIISNRFESNFSDTEYTIFVYSDLLDGNAYGGGVHNTIINGVFNSQKDIALVAAPIINKAFVCWVFNGAYYSNLSNTTVCANKYNSGKFFALFKDADALEPVVSWLDEVETYQSGVGSFESPYRIATAGQLANFLRDCVNDLTHNKFYIITSSIDLSDYYWLIDNTETIFRGNLNGQNYTITGLKTINNSACFIQNLVGATISNLFFKNIYYKNTLASSTNSGLIGMAQDCTIDGINVQGIMYSSAEVNNFGGVIGAIIATSPDNSKIANLEVDCYLNVINAKNIGGVSGYLSNTNIYRSSATLSTVMVLSCQIPENNQRSTSLMSVGSVIGKGDYDSIGVLLGSSASLYITLSTEFYANIGALCGQIGAADMCDADGVLSVSYLDSEVEDRSIISGLVANSGCVVNSYSNISLVTNYQQITFYPIGTSRTAYNNAGNIVTYDVLGQYDRSEYNFYNINKIRGGVVQLVSNEDSSETPLSYTGLEDHIWTINEYGEYVHTQHDDSKYCATLISNGGNTHGSEIRYSSNLNNVYLIATANYKNKFEAWYLNGRLFSTDNLISISLSKWERGTFYAKMQASTENWWDQYDFTISTNSPVKTSRTISCAKDLAYLAYLVEHNYRTNDGYYSELNYRQTADIDLSGYNWIPIGTRYNFNGTYNGDGYKISNMSVSINEYIWESIIARRDTEILKYKYNIDRYDRIIVDEDETKINKEISLGLFGTVLNDASTALTNGYSVGYDKSYRSTNYLDNVIIKGITINNGTINGSTEGLDIIYEYLGSIDPDPDDSDDYDKKEFNVGLIAGTCYSVYNCDLSGQNNSIINVGDHGTIGGLVGNTMLVEDVEVESISIDNCASDNIGGVVGNLFRSSSFVKNITASVSIGAETTTINLGGVVGCCSWDIRHIADTIKILDVIVNGEIVLNDSSTYIAGILGYVVVDVFAASADNTLIIDNCENNLNSLSGTGQISGIVNIISYSSSADEDIIISNCNNNTNILSTSNYAAGIANCNGSATILYCVNYGSVESQSSSCFASGLVNVSNDIYIRSCLNYGDINSAGGACGMIGSTTYYGSGEVTCVYSANHGNVTAGNGAYGLVGDCESAELYNCGNVGAVYGSFANGIIGGVYYDFILSDSCSTGIVSGATWSDIISTSESERYIIDNSFIVSHNEQNNAYGDSIINVMYSKDRVMSDLIKSGIIIKDYFTNMEAERGLPIVNVRLKQENLIESYVYIDSGDKGTASCMQYVGKKSDVFVTEAKANEGYVFVKWLLNGEYFSDQERIIFPFNGDNYFYIFEAVFRSKTYADYGMSNGLVESNGYKQISSFADLNYLRYQVNECGESYLGSRFLLTNDIEIPFGVKWDGIGKEDSIFLGDIYGNNHKITLKIDDATTNNGYTNGLFAYAGTDEKYVGIYDLTMLNSIIKVDSLNVNDLHVGLVVARGYANLYNVSSIGNSNITINGATSGIVCGLSAALSSRVEGCTSYTNINAENMTVIGITMGTESAKIENSTNSATLIGKYVYGISKFATEIVSCVNLGTLIGEIVAGLIYEIGDEGKLLINKNYGTIIASENASGLVMFAGNKLDVENCINTATINCANGTASGLIHTVDSINSMEKSGNSGRIFAISASGLIYHLGVETNDYLKINLLKDIYNNARINADSAAAFVFETSYVEIYNAYNNSAVGENYSYLINRNNYGEDSTNSIIILNNVYNVSLLSQKIIENYTSQNAYHYLSDNTKWIGYGSFYEEKTFEGFDFEHTWSMDDDLRCPYLVSEVQVQSSQLSATEIVNENQLSIASKEVLCDEIVDEPSFANTMSALYSENFDYGEIDIQFAGMGTEAEPYLISSASELRGLAYLVNSKAYNSRRYPYTACYYELTRDISISDYNWIPIGLDLIVLSTIEGTLSESNKHYFIEDGDNSWDISFHGYFNGHGHKISGLTMDYSSALLQCDEYYIYNMYNELVEITSTYNKYGTTGKVINRVYGLFGDGGSISDLVLEDVDIKVDGSILKQLDQDDKVVEASHFNNQAERIEYTVRATTYNVNVNVEEVGLIGIGSVTGFNGRLINCAALSGDINVTNTGFEAYMYNNRTSRVVGSAYVGGLSGIPFSVQSCINLTDITIDSSTSPVVGGIAGAANNILNSMNFGTISLNNCSLNDLDEYLNNYSASALTYNWDNYIINLRPRKNLGHFIGGIVGEGIAAYSINYGTIDCEGAHPVETVDTGDDNYWLEGSVVSTEGRPCSEEFLKSGDINNFAGFDFSIWDFCVNAYPDLRCNRLFTKEFSYYIQNNFYKHLSAALGFDFSLEPIEYNLPNSCWKINNYVIFYGTSIIFGANEYHNADGMFFRDLMLLNGVTYRVSENGVLTFMVSNESSSTFDLRFEQFSDNAVNLDLNDLTLAGGKGTPEDPYLVESVEDWALITALINGTDYDQINTYSQTKYPYECLAIDDGNSIIIDGVTYTYSATGAYGIGGVSNNGSYVAINPENQITFGGIPIEYSIDENGNSLSVSVDGGITWTNITAKSCTLPSIGLMYDYVQGFSLDNGETWVPLNGNSAQLNLSIHRDVYSIRKTMQNNPYQYTGSVLDYDEDLANGSQFKYRNNDEEYQSLKFSYYDDQNDIMFKYDTVSGLSIDDGETWAPVARAVVINNDVITHDEINGLSLDNGRTWTAGTQITSIGGTVYIYDMVGASGGPGIRIDGTEVYYPLYDYESYAIINETTYYVRKDKNHVLENNMPAIKINDEWHNFCVDASILGMQVSYNYDYDENVNNGSQYAYRTGNDSWTSATYEYIDENSPLTTSDNVVYLYDTNQGVSIDNGINWTPLARAVNVNGTMITHHNTYGLSLDNGETWTLGNSITKGALTYNYSENGANGYPGIAIEGIGTYYPLYDYETYVIINGTTRKFRKFNNFNHINDAPAIFINNVWRDLVETTQLETNVEFTLDDDGNAENGLLAAVRFNGGDWQNSVIQTGDAVVNNLHILYDNTNGYSIDNGGSFISPQNREVREGHIYGIAICNLTFEYNDDYNQEMQGVQPGVKQAGQESWIDLIGDAVEFGQYTFTYGLTDTNLPAFSIGNSILALYDYDRLIDESSVLFSDRKVKFGNTTIYWSYVDGLNCLSNGGFKHYSKAKYKLISSIDLEKKLTTSINVGIGGVIDGNGYAINNAFIVSSDEYAGLFSTNYGTIKNVRINNAYLCSLFDTRTEGWLGLVGKNEGVIENVSMYNTIQVGDTIQRIKSAVIVGKNNGENVIIDSCLVSNSIVLNCVLYDNFTPANSIVIHNYPTSFESNSRNQESDAWRDVTDGDPVLINALGDNIHASIIDERYGVICLVLPTGVPTTLSTPNCGNTSVIGWRLPNGFEVTELTPHASFTLNADKSLTFIPQKYNDFTGSGNYTIIYEEIDVIPDSIPRDTWQSNSSYYTTVFAGGNGFQNSPYIIETAEQLAGLAFLTSNDSHANFLLNNDIDISEHRWVPINKPILFNGNGHRITGLIIEETITTSGTYYYGLFGNNIYTQVNNLYLDNVYINITNNYLSNLENGSSTAKSNIYIGAIGGQISSISACQASGTIKLTNAENKKIANYYVGGIIGYSDYKAEFLVNKVNIFLENVNKDTRVNYERYVSNVVGYAYSTNSTEMLNVGHISLTDCDEEVFESVHLICGANLSRSYAVVRSLIVNGISQEDIWESDVIIKKDYELTIEETYSNWSIVDWVFEPNEYPTPRKLIGNIYVSVHSLDGIAIITGEGAYDIGEEVVIEFTILDPDAYVFDNWSINGNIYSSYHDSNGYTIDQSLSLSFTARANTTIEIILNNAYDSWLSDPLYYDINFEGLGTEENPYEISSAAELAGMAYSVGFRQDYNTKYYKLTADVDISAHNWFPIGWRDYRVDGKFGSRFEGSFDGNGHYIEGLTINRELALSNERYGLFGEIYSFYSVKICNVLLKNVDINIEQNSLTCIVGTLAGSASGGYELSNIGVESGTINTGNLVTVGGLVGSTSATIRNCYTNIEKIGDASGAGIAGGQGNTEIINSYSTSVGFEYLLANNEAEITSSFGLSDAGLGSSRTEAQMKKASTYNSWSNDIWIIVDNEYPVLKSLFRETWISVSSNANNTIVTGSRYYVSGSNIRLTHSNHVENLQFVGWQLPNGHIIERSTAGYIIDAFTKALSFTAEASRSGNYVAIYYHTNTWTTEGNYADEFAGGHGTQMDPYQISTPAQLARVAVIENNNPESTNWYVLTNNIDLSGNYWTEIGIESSRFSGTFDGCGYYISNMQTIISYQKGYLEYAGLFGVTELATIRNINLICSFAMGDNISVRNDIGVLVNKSINSNISNCYCNYSINIDYVIYPNIAIAAIARVDGGTVRNCVIEGSINIRRIFTMDIYFSSQDLEEMELNQNENSVYIAGAVAFATGAVLSNVTSSSSISINTETSCYKLMVGSVCAYAGNSLIEYCDANSEMSICLTSSHNTFIAGVLANSDETDVKYSSSNSVIKVDIIDYAPNINISMLGVAREIQNSYAIGKIDFELGKSIRDVHKYYISGLGEGVISNCYADVSIVSNGFSMYSMIDFLIVNPLTVNNWDSCMNAYYVKDAFAYLPRNIAWDNVVFSVNTSEKVSPLTKNESKTKSKYVNFDFVNTWVIDEQYNGGLPRLRLTSIPSSIVLLSNNDNYGVVEYNELLNDEKNVVIRAKANEGYVFKYWLHNNHIVSINEIYKIDRLRLNTVNKLIAVFDIINTKEETYQVYIDADNGEIGTFVSEGPYLKGSLVTVIAHAPNAGFVFDGWYKNDIKQSSLQSYSFVVSDNILLYAKYVEAEEKWEDSPVIAKAVEAITTINSISEFVWFMQTVNNGESFTNRRVVLNCNIDLSGKLWTPIGTKDHPFSGVFDGSYYIVSNVTIKGDYAYSGLFGVVAGGEINNLGINDVRINENNSNALIIGALVGAMNGSIINSEVNNCNIDAKSDNQLYIGGMVGWMYGSIIRAYVNTNIKATILGSNTSKKVVVGGVVGVVKDNSQLSEIIGNSDIIIDALSAKVSTDGIVGNQLEEITANSLICNSDAVGTYSYATYLPKELLYLSSTYESFQTFSRIWSFASVHDGLPIIKQFNNAGVQIDLSYNLLDAGYVVFSREDYKEGDDVFINMQTNPGFSFVKWQLDGVDYSTSQSIKLEDLKPYQELKAYFMSDTSYKLRLITNGGELDNYYVNVMLGEKISDKLAIPTLNGKSFVSYRLFSQNGPIVDSSTYVNASFIENIVDGYINIYAEYVNENVKLVLHPNGGTLMSLYHSTAYGSVVSHLPTPQKNGYVFVGWWTKDGSEDGDWGNKIADGNYIYSPLTDLYAKYSQFTYSVSASSNNSNYGYIEGVGEYEYGSIATITARAYAGYGIAHISIRKGNDMFETTQSKIVLRVESNIVVSVFFTTLNTIVSVFAGEGGTVTSEDIVVNSRQSVQSTREITISATPSAGYAFIGWYSDNAFISDSNPYTFTASSNASLSAVFALQAQNLFSIELLSSNEDLGKVLINGLTTRGKYKGGTQITLDAHPSFGIRFVGWYDGDTLISTQKTYSHTVASSLAITGRFETYTYSELDAIVPQIDGDIYSIASAENLIWLATQVNNGTDFAGKRFVQTRNIDISNAYWTPIGTAENPFTSAFDGQGYHISGMRLLASESGNYGLFGMVENAELTAVSLKNATVIGGVAQNRTRNVGVLCGYGANQTQIKECSISGEIVGNFDSYTKIGGAVGVSFGAITNCDVNVNISINGAIGLTVGGVVGINIGEVGFVKSTSSVNIACVADETTNFVAGGIIGTNSGINSKVYSNVMLNSIVKIANSNQSSNDNYVGAIIGFVDGSTLLVKGNQYLSQDTISGTGNGLVSVQIDQPIARASAWFTDATSFTTLEWYNVLNGLFNTAWNENIWSITNGMSPSLLKAKSIASGNINISCNGALPTYFAQRVNIKIIGVGVVYSYYISSAETISLLNLNAGRYRIICTLADQGYVSLSSEVVEISRDNPVSNVFVTLYSMPSNISQGIA